MVRRASNGKIDPYVADIQSLSQILSGLATAAIAIIVIHLEVSLAGAGRSLWRNHKQLAKIDLWWVEVRSMENSPASPSVTQLLQRWGEGANKR